MRVLKAYTDAGMLGQDTTYPNVQPAQTRRPRTNVPSRGGDVISISDEARDLMQQDMPGGMSVTPQDAVYDQRGNIMRQFDSLQGDLRALSAKIMTNGENDAIMNSLRGMQSQLTTLRAQV